MAAAASTSSTAAPAYSWLRLLGGGGSSPSSSPLRRLLLLRRGMSGGAAVPPTPPAVKPPNASRLSIKSAEQAAWAAQHGVVPPGVAAEASEGGSIAGSIPRGFWEARQEAFNAIPTVPKILGFAGVPRAYWEGDTGSPY